MNNWTRGLWALLLVTLCAAGHATILAPMPPETRVVAAASAAPPTIQAFTIASAQDLTITFKDSQIPGPLASAYIAITKADQLVGSATLAPPATSAVVSVPGAVGDYTLYVFGSPNATYSVGTFTVCVAPASDPANCIQNASLAGNFTAQGTASDPTVSTLSVPITVTTAGSYTVTFADAQFPAALNVQPNLGLFQGSTVVQTAITSGSALNLNPGNYTLLALAQADPTAKAGLYTVTIAMTGSPPLLDRAVPVGLTSPTAPFENPTAQAVTLSVTDYAFPNALTSASALVTSGGTVLGTSSAGGTATTFNAPAGALNIWTYAAAGAGPGTFSATVSGATNLYTAAHSVGSGGSAYAFAYVSSVLPAGDYIATAADLQFPSQLSGLAFAVAQNGTVLQTSTSAATLNFTAAAGPVVLLVSAQTPASGSVSGNGLFDVNVQSTGAAGQILYDKVQAVSSTSALYDIQTLTVGVSGTFDASLSDLKFPEQFGNLSLVVSRGSEVLGKIYGGGTFSFSASPGQYQMTFVASPDATKNQLYGLYAVSVVPSLPTVTLTSSVASAPNGTAITLSWTSSNASSCTASGGNFVGPQATGSGSLAVLLNGATTYTLTCSGDGGSVSASVNVTATTVTSSSHSGGGALSLEFLSALLLLVLGRQRLQKNSS